MMRYKKEPAFVNRHAELSWLTSWIAERPEHILFLYGPKSSGKTTVIYRTSFRARSRHLAWICGSASARSFQYAARV
jgi:AAA+ ATPase superfamily predicted ATPase